MNMRTILGVVLALASMAAAADLNEVSTLADLRKTPAIAIGENIEIHLGISRSNEDPWRVVYCLARDKRGPEQVLEYEPVRRGADLGPVLIELRWSGDSERMQSVGIAYRERGEVLFYRFIPAARKGTCNLQVLTPDHRVLASATLTNDKPRPWPWLAFTQPRREGAQLRYDVVDESALYAPASDFGMFLTGKLPDLLPPEPALRLSLDQDHYVIRSTGRKMWDWTDLIARWWVNGKSVEADRIQRVVMLGTQTKEIQEVRISFKLPSMLGTLRAGDKVQVQVMYCPIGIEPGGERTLAATRQTPRQGDTLGLALSNILEIPVTEAMVKARPQP